ncbi:MULTISPECIES: flavin reductase family protein [unclassified Phenylobacterium]|uniref:flavin reductase family protein n=1 Tax=unclassified Phenylobacterium TaxID=2640670 RepID=UPI003ECCC127
MGLVHPLAPASPRLDAARLRDGMARLASGVTLITCWADGAPVGLAATSLVSLSVDPPRVLFSVRRAASAHDGLLKAGRCAAVALAEDDLEEARLFAVSDAQDQRFKSAAWNLSDDFAPRYAGGVARFDLAIEHRIRAADHTILIAEVLEVASQPGAPLLYFERSFTGLVQAPQPAA